MIEIKNITKKFGDLTALSSVSATIEEGQVFGLVGTNGAGKSTLMRSICGIYRPEEGAILVDEAPVFENPAAKSKLFYISDSQFYFPGGTPTDQLRFYETYYPSFNTARFHELMKVLNLDENRKINTFSKGMKKQLSVLFGVCSGCKYLLCDETFDGLDPVIRQAIKKLFIQEMDENKLTPIIASHNLRELEDICDHIGLLHKGGILFSKDLEEMKLGMFKLQVVFRQTSDLAIVEKNFPIVNSTRQGSLHTLTLRGGRVEIETFISAMEPVFFEILPLSLEEIFISETEVLGYEFTNLTH